MSNQPVILLLHGVQSSRSTWWRATRDLTDLGWSVLAVDLLGQAGRLAPRSSSVETLANDVLEQVHGRRVDLIVGHSLGAIVALTIVRLRRGRIRGVVLEDPPCLGGTSDSVDDFERSVARAHEDPGGEVARLLEEHPAWAAADARLAVESRRALDVEQVSRFLRTHGWDLPNLVRECPVPVHLLAATDPGSALIDPDRSALIDSLPPERVSYVASGHSIHRDRPAIWLNAVLGFAASLDLCS
jgi:pimeloyl-ACP methyl ester carboxylesterase